MSELKWVGRAGSRVDRWLARPEARAAGRLGLFRILFALFYLWHLSPQFIANLSGLTERHHNRTLLVEWARPYLLPAEALQATESALVASLVLLLIGYRTRMATLAVLVLGTLYEGWLIAVDLEHATVFIAFYIPLFMLLSGRWGDTYSLDAHLRRRAGLFVVDPADDGWRFALPARAILVVLVLLFCSAAAFKILENWLQQPDLLANTLLERNVKAAVRELPLNPLAPFIAQRSWLSIPMQGLIILFEGLFILALFGGRLRDLFLSSALLFHAVSGLWLMVTFTPLLIVYALFVDLESWRQWLLPRRTGGLVRFSGGLLVGVTVALAVTAGVLWNTGTALRTIAGTGGLLDWRTIWYVVGPLAAWWWVRSVAALVRRGRPLRSGAAGRAEGMPQPLGSAAAPTGAAAELASNRLPVPGPKLMARDNR